MDAVLLDPDQLVRLSIGDAELHRLASRSRRGDFRGLGTRSRSKNKEVAQNHAADDVVVGEFPGAHDIHVVAGLKGAGKQLVGVTRELVRTLSTLDLSPDSLLSRRRKASRAYLLALEDVLRGDVLGELAGRRDRARDNCLAGHGLLLEHLLID